MMSTCCYVPSDMLQCYTSSGPGSGSPYPATLPSDELLRCPRGIDVLAAPSHARVASIEALMPSPYARANPWEEPVSFQTDPTRFCSSRPVGKPLGVLAVRAIDPIQPTATPYRDVVGIDLPVRAKSHLTTLARCEHPIRRESEILRAIGRPEGQAHW